MGHYKSNMRDLQFNLFEVFELDKVLESGEFGDLDHETAVDMLREVKNLAEGVIADSFADADRNPPTFDPDEHSVTIPEASRSPTTRSSRAAGTRSVSPRSSAACPHRGRCTGPSVR